MKLLDYVFYRIYSFYKKRKDANPISMGCLVIALTAGLTVLSCITIFSLFYNRQIKFTDFQLLYIMVLFTTWLLLVRKFKMNGVVQNLSSRYAGEDIKQRKLRGWIIVLYIELVMLIPITIGALRHNFGFDI